MNVLKPVSINATIGLTTKPCYSEDSKSTHSTTNSNEKVHDTPSCSYTSSKLEISVLGVCIHIDITPINICISEIQVKYNFLFNFPCKIKKLFLDLLND